MREARKSSRASQTVPLPIIVRTLRFFFKRFYAIPYFFHVSLVEQILNQIDLGVRNDLGGDRTPIGYCSISLRAIPSLFRFHFQPLQDDESRCNSNPACCKVSLSELRLQVSHKRSIPCLSAAKASSIQPISARESPRINIRPESC